MEKFLDELILSERKKRKEKVLDKQIDLERDLPEQYLQTVVMSDKATSIKIPAFRKNWWNKNMNLTQSRRLLKAHKTEALILRFHCLMYQWNRDSLEKFARAASGHGEEFYRKSFFMRKGRRTLTASGFIGWNIPIMRQEESYIISCFMQRQSRHLWGV